MKRKHLAQCNDLFVLDQCSTTTTTGKGLRSIAEVCLNLCPLSWRELRVEGGGTFGFLTFSELEVHTARPGTAAVFTKLAPQAEGARLKHCMEDCQNQFIQKHFIHSFSHSKIN